MSLDGPTPFQKVVRLPKLIHSISAPLPRPSGRPLTPVKMASPPLPIPSPMRMHILGAGSIGCLLAWHLRKASPSLPISLLMRRGTLRQIQYPRCPSVTMQNGGPNGAPRPIGRFDLEVTRTRNVRNGDESDLDADVVDVVTRANVEKGETKRPFGIIQSLVVSTKAQDAPWGVEDLFNEQRLTSKSTIVLLTNGMGVYEHLVSTIFSDPEKRPNFVLATTNHGATSTGPLQFIHAGIGSLHYAVVPDPLLRPHPYNNPSPSPAPFTHTPPPPDSQFFSLHHTLSSLHLLQTSLNSSQESIQYLQMRMLQKLVVNCCVNPLTALFDVPNGDLLEYDDARLTIRQVCSEAAQIFAALAEEAVASGGDVQEDLDPATAALQFRRPFTADDLEDAVLRTIRLTNKNISSMLQDVRKGKFGTEIDYLNGYLSRLGQLHGIETPTIDALAEAIKELPIAEQPKKKPFPWWASRMQPNGPSS